MNLTKFIMIFKKNIFKNSDLLYNCNKNRNSIHSIIFNLNSE